MTTKELFLAQWQNESKSTLAAINALPDNTSFWNYRPHAKARSAKQLLEHFLHHAAAIAGAVDTKVIQEGSVAFSSKEEMAAYFQSHSDLVVSNISTVDDNTWETANVDFVISPTKTYTMPMVQMFYLFMFDMIHHRGQLSTYYRAMAARNPNIYGPSAEDIEEMMSAMAASN